MAHIRDIRFAHVGRKEGCTCDKCGQYIQNIVTVEYTDGVTIRYGQDCFDNLYHNGGLSDFGKKLMRKTLKDIQYYTKQRELYVSGKMTAETDKGWQAYAYEWNKNTYWGAHHDDYEAYRRWMIDEWFPERFKEIQKNIDRFGKVNFNR